MQGSDWVTESIRDRRPRRAWCHETCIIFTDRLQLVCAENNKFCCEMRFTARRVSYTSAKNCHAKVYICTLLHGCAPLRFVETQLTFMFFAYTFFFSPFCIRVCAPTSLAAHGLEIETDRNVFSLSLSFSGCLLLVIFIASQKVLAVGL